MSVPETRSHLGTLLEALGLRRFAFRWYSFRRGGASAFYQATSSMELTLVRGRWESSKTARVYLAEGLAQLALLNLTQQETDFITLCCYSLREKWKAWKGPALHRSRLL